MAVLVTGGAGYIGSHTCVELLQSGYDLVVIDNLSNSNLETISRIEHITGKTVPFFAGDICDAAFLEQIFQDHHLDAVIHFAGLKAVGESVERPLAYYYNNISGTLVLCQTMQKFGVTNMVFSSSATVYGMAEEMPIREDTPLEAINPYGRTKWMIEQILQDVYISDSSWGMALLRYFNPIGAHESGLIGENPKGIPNNLMPYITQVAAGKLDVLTIYGDDYDTPDGTGIRDYIHVVDLAKGHVSALQFVMRHKGVESFNLGTGTGYSVLEVVTTFEEVNQVKIPYQIGERRAGDVAVSFADVSKANNLLHWNAAKDLKDMCSDAWRWESQH